MRFGFFFFAEYVNVFIVSALTVDPVLRRLDRAVQLALGLQPQLARSLESAPCWVGIAFLARRLIGTDRAAPCRSGSSEAAAGACLDAIIARLRSSRPLWSRGPRRAGAASSPSTGSRGLFWFMGKTYVLRLRLRLDASHAAAGPGRPADGLRLEVAAARVLAEPLRDGCRRRPSQPVMAPMSFVPGLGIAKGMALTLRRFFEPKATIQYPETQPDHGGQVPRPAPAALRRVRQPQVRDLLPVRPGLPCRVHRHGRLRHEGPLPRPLGRARDVRRAARGIGPAPLRPAGARPGLRPLRARRHGRRATHPRGARLRPAARRSAILEEIQAAYGYLPVAALKHVSHVTGAPYALIYGTATYYRHLHFDKPARTVAVCRCTSCLIAGGGQDREGARGRARHRARPLARPARWRSSSCRSTSPARRRRW